MNTINRFLIVDGICEVVVEVFGWWLIFILRGEAVDV